MNKRQGGKNREPYKIYKRKKFFIDHTFLEDLGDGVQYFIN